MLTIEDGPFDVIIDGTDNVETRYLLNDACVKLGLPWIYGACVGVEGRVMAILPGKSACLRCVFPTPPAAGELPTCDTAGVLAAAAAMVASTQVVETIKLLTSPTGFSPALLRIDAWSHSLRTTPTHDARRDDCPACGLKQFSFLDGRRRNAISLCGRDAIQIRPPRDGARPSLLNDVMTRLGGELIVTFSPHFLRFKPELRSNFQLTLFPDGRLIVHGTNDSAVARSLHARFVGT